MPQYLQVDFFYKRLAQTASDPAAIAQANKKLLTKKPEISSNPWV